MISAYESGIAAVIFSNKRYRANITTASTAGRQTVAKGRVGKKCKGLHITYVLGRMNAACYPLARLDV